MKLGVLASRSITDQETVDELIDYIVERYFEDDISCVISGSGSSVEKKLIQQCKDSHIDHVLFEPYFVVDKKSKHNPAHFFARNKQIVDNSDVVVIFWDQEDRGEEFAINYAKKKNKGVDVSRI